MNPRMKICLIGKWIVPLKVGGAWISKHTKNVQYYQKIETTDQYKLIQAEIAQVKEKIDREREALYQDGLDEETTSELMTRVDVQAEKFEILRSTLRRLQREWDHYSVDIIFGLEVENRKDYGIHVYLNGRLITWGWKNVEFFQRQKNCQGFSMYINIVVEEKEHFILSINKAELRMTPLFRKRLSNVLTQYEEYLEKSWIILYLRNWNQVVAHGDNQWKMLWNNYGYMESENLSCSREEWTSQTERIHVGECGYWYFCQNCHSWKHTTHPIEHEGVLRQEFVCRNLQNVFCTALPLNDVDALLLPILYHPAEIAPQRQIVVEEMEEEDDEVVAEEARRPVTRSITRSLLEEVEVKMEVEEEVQDEEEAVAGPSIKRRAVQTTRNSAQRQGSSRRH